MQNRHESWDLKQMQSLPLEAKIRMTKMRIQAWYESWTRFEIYDKETGKTRFVTMDTRDQFAEPDLNESEFIKTTQDGQVYVSFSGGKDSTVLKHIVDSMYDDVPAVFVNTGLEYPEIQRFVKDIKDGKYDCFSSNVEIVRPEMRFDQVLKTYGYPVITKRISNTIHYAKKNIADGKETERTKALDGKLMRENGTSFFNCSKWKFVVDAPFDVSDQCCNVMKKKPVKKYTKESGRLPMTAQMASESMQRRAQWIQHGCNAFDKKSPISNPMSFWTEEDILEYIRKYDVPYCPVYGDIVETDEGLKTTQCDRTGCIFCMFGCHLEKGENRFQRLKKTHPRQYEYCIGGGEMVDGKLQPNKEGLGLGKVLDYINVKYD